MDSLHITEEAVMVALLEQGPIDPGQLVEVFHRQLKDSANPHKRDNRTKFREIIDAVAIVCEGDQKQLRLRDDLVARATKLVNERKDKDKEKLQAEPEGRHRQHKPITPEMQRKATAVTTSGSATEKDKASEAKPDSPRRQAPPPPSTPSSNESAAPAVPTAASAAATPSKRRLAPPPPAGATPLKPKPSATTTSETQATPADNNASTPVQKSSKSTFAPVANTGDTPSESRSATPKLPMPGEIRSRSSSIASELGRTPGVRRASRLTGRGSDLSLIGGDAIDEDMLDPDAFRANRIRFFTDSSANAARGGVRELSKYQRRWLRCAVSQDLVELAQLIDSRDDIVNCCDKFSGYAAIHWAAKLGNSKMLKLLAQSKNLQLNARTFGGATALHLAFQFNHHDIQSQLLKLGAREDIPDNNGRLPTDLAPLQQATNPVILVEPEAFSVPADATLTAKTKRQVVKQLAVRSSSFRPRSSTAPSRRASVPGDEAAVTPRTPKDRKSTRKIFSMFRMSTAEPQMPQAMLSPEPSKPMASGCLVSPTAVPYHESQLFTFDDLQDSVLTYLGAFWGRMRL